MAPIVVNGNLFQEPVIPKWLLKALLLLLALLLALFILWKTLLKPSVESAAREVAIEEVAPVSSAVEQLEPAVEEAAAQAEQAPKQAAQAEEAAAGGGGGRRWWRWRARQRVQRDERPDELPPAGHRQPSERPGRPPALRTPTTTTFALTDSCCRTPVATSAGYGYW